MGVHSHTLDFTVRGGFPPAKKNRKTAKSLNASVHSKLLEGLEVRKKGLQKPHAETLKRQRGGKNTPEM